MRFYFNKAGLFGFDYSKEAPETHHYKFYNTLWFFVKFSYWEWGHRTEAYDCLFEYYGLGPFFLFVKPNFSIEDHENEF